MNRKYIAISTIRKYVSSERGKKLPVLIGSYMPTKLYKYKSMKGSVAQCEAISPRPSKRAWPATAIRPCRCGFAPYAKVYTISELKKKYMGVLKKLNTENK